MMMISQLLVAAAMIIGLHVLATHMSNNGMTYGVWIMVLVASTLLLVFGLDLWVTGDIGSSD